MPTARPIAQSGTTLSTLASACPKHHTCRALSSCRALPLAHAPVAMKKKAGEKATDKAASSRDQVSMVTAMYDGIGKTTCVSFTVIIIGTRACTIIIFFQKFLSDFFF